MNRKTIYLHKLYQPIETKITRIIFNAGYTINDDFSKLQYDNMSKRLKRIYSRTNSYENKLINIWRLSDLPGVLIYCSNGESYGTMNLKNIDQNRVVRKSRLEVEDVESLLIKGKVVLYYGLEKFEGIEMFITEKRLAQLAADPYFKTIELFSDSKINLNVLNPFRDNINVVSIRNVNLLSIIPRFLSSLDTVVNGIELFTSAGLLSDFVKPYLCKFRLISVFDVNGATTVYSINDVTNLDKLIDSNPFDELTIEQKTLLIDVKKKLGYNVNWSNKDRVIRQVKLILRDRTYVIYTILPFPPMIRYQSIDEELLQDILLFSNANTIQLTQKDKESRLIIKTDGNITSLMSNSMFSVAMSLRKTFRFDFNYSLCIICEKGSYKSKVIDMLNEYIENVFVVDSDIYGKWITYCELHKLDSNESVNVKLIDVINLPSYFETLMSVTCERNTNVDGMDIIDIFSRSYSQVLSSKIYGIQKFQDFIYTNGHTNRVILFTHSTCEANLLSGHWQHVVIRPINDTLESVITRERDNVKVQKMLYYAYKYMTSYGTRIAISFLELFFIICPEIINFMRVKQISEKVGLH